MGMRLLRMMPGYGETLVIEGDPRLDDERDALVAAFQRQLEEGMWAGVPVTDACTGRRRAVMVTDFADIPDDADRVLFWPRAAGGAPPA